MKELLNGVASPIIGFLSATIISLLVYIYTTEKTGMDEELSKVAQVSKEITNDAKSATKDANTANVSLLEKIYTISSNTDEKVNGVQRDQAVQAEKMSMIDYKIDTTLSKLADHERRITQLEKNEGITKRNIEAIAKKRNITLFGLDY